MSDSMLQLHQFIENHGYNAKLWCVGIAVNAEEVLFVQHKVDRKRDSWIYRLADSSDTARAVYDSLIKLGCRGNPEQNEPRGTMVYVYLKSPNLIS